MNFQRMHFKRRCGRWVTILLVLGASGCAQNGLGDPTGSTCPSDSKLSYADFGEPFMRKHCAGCHEDFSSQAGVQASIDEIDRAAAAGPDTVNTYMPEDEELSDKQREELGEWLACGAP